MRGRGGSESEPKRHLCVTREHKHRPYTLPLLLLLSPNRPAAGGRVREGAVPGFRRRRRRLSAIDCSGHGGPHRPTDRPRVCVRRARACVCGACSSGATRRRRSARRWNAPPHESPATSTDARRRQRLYAAATNGDDPALQWGEVYWANRTTDTWLILEGFAGL